MRTNYKTPMARKVKRGQSPASPASRKALVMTGDRRDIYLELDGVRIAKRGHPGTPQARTWVSLEPGYVVFDSWDTRELIVEYHEPRGQ